MPVQSLLRIIKRWRRYEERGDWRIVPSVARGVYVLYLLKGGRYRVIYIGVAGLNKIQKSGIASRLRSHHKKRKNWTHYSFFEVHDNVTHEEIRELESFLLSVFRHDDRIGLEKQTEEFQGILEASQDRSLERCSGSEEIIRYTRRHRCWSLCLLE